MTALTFAGFDYPRAMWDLPAGTPAARLAHRRKYGPSPCGPSYYPAPNVVRASDDCKRGTYHTDDADGPASGLRWRWCDDVPDVNIRHRGWYCDDEMQNYTMRGFVARLPRSRGFVIGWSMGDGMCAVVDYSSAYDSEIDAALAADSFAEYAAGEERDYQRTERERFEAEEEQAARDDAADDWRVA